MDSFGFLYVVYTNYTTYVRGEVFRRVAQTTRPIYFLTSGTLWKTARRNFEIITNLKYEERVSNDVCMFTCVHGIASTN